MSQVLDSRLINTTKKVLRCKNFDICFIFILWYYFNDFFWLSENIKYCPAIQNKFLSKIIEYGFCYLNHLLFSQTFRCRLNLLVNFFFLLCWFIWNNIRNLFCNLITLIFFFNFLLCSFISICALNSIFIPWIQIDLLNCLFHLYKSLTILFICRLVLERFMNWAVLRLNTN